MSSDNMCLTVCIITSNEEARLPACLASVSWVPEIVVVDDFSSDSTPAICRSYSNVRYVAYAFEGFGLQKRQAVNLASNEWILSIDADEEVTPELRAEINAVVQSGTQLAGFTVRRNNFMFGRLRPDNYPGSLRLFRKSRGNFNSSCVHERVQVEGDIGQLHGFLLHKSRAFESFRAHWQTCALQYGRLACEDYHSRGVRITLINSAWLLAAIPLLMFLREHILKGKFRQGRAGLYVSITSAACYHVAYATLLRKQRQDKKSTPSTESVPAERYTRDYFLHHRGGSDDFIRSKGKELCDAHRFALDLADIKSTDDVLDLGCGCGEVALNAASLARLVTAVDYSPDAISLAREALGGFDRRTVAKVSFFQADIGSWVFPTESFDVVFCLDVVEHLTQEEISLVLTRAYRCLRVGGRLVVHTWPNRWHRRFTYPLSYHAGRFTGHNRPRDPRTEFEQCMHVSEQSPASLKANLKRAGLSSRVFVRHMEPIGNSTSKWIHWVLHALPPMSWFFCDNVWALGRKQEQVNSFNDSPRLAGSGVWECVAAMIGNCEGQRILDAPAGSGGFSGALSDKGAKVISLDVSMNHASGADWVTADLNATLPFSDASFDTVVCIEGIEHLENPAHALKEFARVVRKGGMVIVTTPNTLNIRSRIKFIVSGELFWFGASAIKRYGHVTPLFHPQLEHFCEKAGFRDIRLGVNRLVPWMKAAAVLLAPFFRLRGSVSNSPPLLSGEILVLAMRKP